MSYSVNNLVFDQSVGKVDVRDGEQLRHQVASGKLLEVGTVGEAKAVIDNKFRRSGGVDRK